MKSRTLYIFAIFILSLSLFSCEKEAPTQLELSSTVITLDNIGAHSTVEVTANSNWSASVASSWCTISPMSGKGNGVIQITADDNLGEGERVVSIVVTSRELKKYVKIVQDISLLELVEESLLFPKGESSKTIGVKSNTSWEIVVPQEASWLSVDPKKGEGDKTVTITTTLNSSPEREANITFKYGLKNKSFNIRQERGYNRPPNSPKLGAPSNGALNISRVPTFRWSGAKDPDGDEVSYVLEYSDNPDNWQNSVELKDTIYYATTLFTSNKRYYWRVTAVDNFDKTASLPSQGSFTTGSLSSYFEGEYKRYQTFTKGNSPSIIIFTGDGYQSEDFIEGGAFDRDINEGIEALFSVEPYKSYREYFTIYKLAAYSRDKGISQSDKNIKKNTKFGTDFTGGSSLMTSNNDLFEFTKSIEGVNDETLKNILIVLVVNQDRYAGTCWMWSDGKSISIVPVSRSTAPGSHYSNLIIHESGGHGFGRLADEYVNSTNTGKAIPESEINTFNSLVQSGYYPNVDLTGDQNKVKWKHFIDHPSYPRVKTFEGAYYYALGAWRPESTSCMVDNQKYYNAPSREAIVKRILKTAGEQFNFETFIQKDVVKAPATYSLFETKSYNPLTFIPLAPPVIVK